MKHMALEARELEVKPKVELHSMGVDYGALVDPPGKNMVSSYEPFWRVVALLFIITVIECTTAAQGSKCG